MSNMTVKSAPLSLTQSAADRLSKLSEQSGRPQILRIAVDGGGCSGFQYHLDLVDEHSPNDHIIQKSGQMAVIDPVSLPLLAGSIVDFVEDLNGAQFKILNPNAKSSCGCGLSFSI